MEISKELRLFSDILIKNGETLYIVGGAVRDDLLGKKAKDIDLASAMELQKVIKFAQSKKFKCTNINENMGTMTIVTKHEKWDFAQFRKESYSKGHTPNEVEFVKDIAIDAKRRDITINAIYYDISKDEIIDPLNARKDLENKIIKTADAPEITLKNDGLRILRVIRFASAFNFTIDKQTYKALEFYKSKILELSKARILDELNKGLIADIEYLNANNIYLNTISKLELCQYIFSPVLSRMRKFSNRDFDYFYTIDRDDRLLALYMLVLKNMQVDKLKEDQLKFLINSIFGLDGIQESKETIRILNRLYSIYQSLEYDEETMNSSINYLSLSDDMRHLVSTLLGTHSKLMLANDIAIIRENELPCSISQLNITNQDLIKLGINPLYITKIMSTLFNQVLSMKLQNNKEDLLKFAKEIDDTFKLLSKQKEKK